MKTVKVKITYSETYVFGKTIDMPFEKFVALDSDWEKNAQKISGLFLSNDDSFQDSYNTEIDVFEIVED